MCGGGGWEACWEAAGAVVSVGRFKDGFDDCSMLYGFFCDC